MVVMVDQVVVRHITVLLVQEQAVKVITVALGLCQALMRVEEEEVQVQ
jgi:hypothetical protein